MINKLDLLSPPITLFHLERRTHTSKVGGCFVIIMLSLIIAYISFLLDDLLGHRRLTSLFHKKFEFEAGFYSFNSSSIFHFIQIFSPDNGGYFDKYDSKYIRAYTTYVSSNFSYSNLDLYDHWVFDECRKDIDDKDLDRTLFENVENFTNGVCIRHYYNSTEKKYYTLEEKGFSWPYLEHGISQRNNIYLTTIIQKCSNDSVINNIFGKCPSQKEIDNYLNKYFGIYLYFTDIQVDPANYTNPITKYLQVVSTGIGTPQTYVESYIHFSPVRVRTNLGSLFGETHDINSFYFDFNRKGAANNNEKYFIITKYYHLMQNNVQIYERIYNNIFDLFSEIGGVAQFTFYLFYWVNFIYNKYIIAYNTNSLFFSIKDNQSTSKEIKNDKNKTICNKKIKNNKNVNSIKLINIKNNIFREIPLIKENKRSSNFCIFKNKIDNLVYDKENINDEKKNSKIKKYEVNNKKNSDYPISKNLNKDRIFKNKLTVITKNKFNNNFNSSNILLKENLNNNITNLMKEKENNSFADLYKKLDLNKQQDNINKIYNKEYLNKMFLTKESLAKIEHIERKSNEVSDDNLRYLKYFSFIDFLKSLLFKKEKESHHFLSTFRKHLLSEEHLLKSHIKMIFMEKQHNFNGEENTNVLECFNEL